MISINSWIYQQDSHFNPAHFLFQILDNQETLLRFKSKFLIARVKVQFMEMHNGELNIDFIKTLNHLFRIIS